MNHGAPVIRARRKRVKEPVSESGHNHDDRVSSYSTVSAYQIALGVLRRLATADKRMLAHRMWLGAKLATFPQIRIEDLPGVSDTLIKGWPGRIDPLILAALAAGLKCCTFFEFGTFRGRTVWTVVHNNPTLKAFSLDLPGPESIKNAALEVTDPHLFETWLRGEAITGTPEAQRITLLTGDSARFDYGPYRNQMDLVYIDGSHSYSYVRSDTEAALELMSATGTVVWDDWYYPGVWKYLQEIRGSLPLYVITDTGMVIHSRHPAMAVFANSSTRCSATEHQTGEEQDSASPGFLKSKRSR